jgi:hypothetical protein
MNATISRRDAGVVLAAVALVTSTAGSAAADVDVASAAVDLYARMTARDLAGALHPCCRIVNWLGTLTPLKIPPTI